MKNLPILKAGDQVEIIAPASRCAPQDLIYLKELLESWQLNCHISHDIFGPDLLCANSDEYRLEALKNALQNPDIKAIICARGGYGCMRLIPGLTQLQPPTSPKLFIGMSDITALQLYLGQHWGWSTIHGSLSRDKFSPESINLLKSILFADIEQIEWNGVPLNHLAEKDHLLESSLTGGNLCLVQASIGTSWQIEGTNKMIFLEEIAERGYRVDRMLEHLKQANRLNDAAAIVFGDFIEGNEPNGSNLLQPVLTRFAEQCHLPVVQIKGAGHGYINYPLILGTKAQLQFGKKIKLTCFRS